MQTQKPLYSKPRQNDFIIKKAKFITSVAKAENILNDNKIEIAIVGKSNVGKSSFINFLTNQNKLAKTSSEPGRTRLVNYFEINDGEFHFVDLPGYGYAKVAKNEQEKWGEMIEGYLLNSESLANVFLLLDIRIEPSDNDKMIVNFLHTNNIDFTVFATKCDKLSKLQLNSMRQKIANELRIAPANIILTSSSKKTGKDDAFDKIGQILDGQKFKQDFLKQQALEEENNQENDD